MDKNGGIYFSAPSNSAKKVNYLTGAVDRTYSIATFGFGPIGERLNDGVFDGYIAFQNIGGAWGIFDPDSTSYQLYTGQPAQFGAGLSNDKPGTIWNSNSTRGLAKGDSGGSQKLYWFEQEHTPNFTISETLIYSATDFNLFAQGGLYPSSRLYFNKSTTTISWVAELTGVITDLVSGLTINSGGHLTGSNTDLYVAIDGTPATVERRASDDGAVLETVTLPTGNNNIKRLYEDPDGRIWVCGSYMICLDPTSLEVIASSQSVSAWNCLGLAGRTFVFWKTSGGNVYIANMNI